MEINGMFRYESGKFRYESGRRWWRTERCAASAGAVCGAMGSGVLPLEMQRQLGRRWRKCEEKGVENGERAKKRAKGRRWMRCGRGLHGGDGGCGRRFFMFYSIFSVFYRAFACGVGFSPYLCSAYTIVIVVIHTAGISVMMSIANSSAWTFFIYIRKVRHALG